MPATSRAVNAHRVTTRVKTGLEALPLRVRLVAIVLVLLFVALTLTGAAMSLMLRRYLINNIDQDLAVAAKPAAVAAFDQFNRSPRPYIPTSYWVRFTRADGSLYFDAGPTNPREHPDFPTLSPNDPRVTDPRPFFVGSTDGTTRWRVVAGTWRAGPEGMGTFAVAFPLDGVDRTVRQVRSLATLIGIGVLAACAVIGWFGVRRAFRPLTQIEDTAAAIAAGDLTRRVPERHAKDEVTSLSRSLNAMLAQIEQSFAAREASEERMRQFVADASHELRTPLAAVRGYAELFRQGAVRRPEDVASAMSRIEDEATRMGGLVEDLLLLARLDDQRPMQFAPVDLTVLAADAVQDARAIDPRREVRLVPLDGELAPTVVSGDEGRLRQVLANLVGNALNHTPPATPVEVAVGSHATGHAGIEVRDHGPGIDPAKARKVFERFYRADPSRVRGTGGGSGLGLAIVAAIVAAHRGRVGVAQTAGGGATFVVDLPTGNSQQAPSGV